MSNTRESGWSKKSYEQEVADAKLGLEKPLFKLLRYCSFLSAAFSIFLLIDYYLPSKTFSEPAKVGWQKTIGSGRRSGRRHQEFITHIKTEHFELAVPHALHLHYDYFSDHREPLNFVVTPWQHIVKEIAVRENGQVVFYRVSTIYTYLLLMYLMLLLSVVIMLAYRYSSRIYRLAYVPVVLFSVFIYLMILYRETYL